jgi:hypothetical protein
MSADNFMFIRKLNGWYVVTMEFASDNNAGSPTVCYKCHQRIIPDVYGTWVAENERSSFCQKGEEGKTAHFAGGYTKIFPNLGEAFSYAEREASGQNDDFGYGTEYGTSYSEEVAKEISQRLT